MTDKVHFLYERELYYFIKNYREMSLEDIVFNFEKRFRRFFWAMEKAYDTQIFGCRLEASRLVLLFCDNKEAEFVCDWGPKISHIIYSHFNLPLPYFVLYDDIKQNTAASLLTMMGSTDDD